VVAVAPGVSQFAVGDAVFGMCSAGSLCEVNVCWADNLASKPASLTHCESCCLVTSGGTALEMLEIANERCGGTLNKVLITAGGGGTGTMLVQMCKNVYGAKHVAVTASHSKRDKVLQLGADEVIDYTTTDFGQALRGQEYDCVIDVLGEFKKSQIVVDGKRPIVTCSGKLFKGPQMAEVMQVYHMGSLPGCLKCCLTCCYGCIYKKNIYTAMLMPTTERLTRVAKMAESGQLKVVMNRIYPFEKSIDAYDYVGEGHVLGKVCVEVVPGAAGSAGVEQISPSTFE
jgi:alcohol dehydrogenase